LSVDGFDAHAPISAQPPAFAPRRSDFRLSPSPGRSAARKGGGEPPLAEPAAVSDLRLGPAQSALAPREGASTAAPQLSTSPRGRGENAIKPTGELSNS
jgi:hypothetical protein